MTYYLVDKVYHKIRSIHAGEITSLVSGMKSSVSGKYVMYTPDFLGIKTETDAVGDLVTEKIEKFKELHSSLPNHKYDELTVVPNIDTTMSTKFISGPYKRSGMLPLGSIVTGLLNVASPTTTVFANWLGFTLASVQDSSSLPGPDRILYNYNPGIADYEEFVSSTFSVEIRNSTNTSTVATLSFNQEQAVALAAGNYRLRFINNSSSRIYYLSDWLLLHD